MPREILIQNLDGPPKSVPLVGPRMTVGRSSAAELSFPEDGGLSRNHFSFEPDGEEWTVQDLGSKNGTFVNNIPLKARLVLKPGDRIAAGHLLITYAPASGRAPTPGVVVFDAPEEGTVSTTVVSSLEGALTNQTMVIDRGGPSKSNAMGALQALIKAGQVLSEAMPLVDLFPVILDLAIQAVNAKRGVLLSLEGDELVPRAHKGEGFRISAAVRDRVIKEKSSVLVRDAQMDDAFKGRMSIVEQKVHTMMAAPLQTKERIIGLLYVDSPFIVRPFSKDDLDLLTVMANVAAIRIETARLAEIEEAERIMQRDLSQAAEIQGGVLPRMAPEVAGADLAGFNSACRTVGGDYYDFFPYPDGRVALALGDVSGKGMPASLMMMALHARVQVLAEDPSDVGALVTRLNKATCAKCPSNRFITFFFSVFNPATGEVAFANAGHNPPFVIRADGSAEMIGEEGGGPPLGIVPIFPYKQQTVTLGPGDMLAIYSDGVTEATNANYDEFGEDRFKTILAENRTRPSIDIVDTVTAAISEFVAGAPQADDITLVVAKRL